MDTSSFLIVVCLATYKRQELLRRLLESFNHIDIPEGSRVEFRVVDNDEDGSARDLVTAFSEKNVVFGDVSYSIQPVQNIALTRNAAIDAGIADAFVFIDDDEEVGEGWLTALVGTFCETGADAVFGPVIGRVSANFPKWLSRGGFYDKPVPVTGTEVDWKETRTSNTLVGGLAFYGPDSVRFDPKMGRSGGSDSHLFSVLQLRGARFVSCREAVVWEDVPLDRARYRWLWNRWFRNGMIYERIAAQCPEERHPLNRAMRRGVAVIACGIKSLPRLLVGRSEDFRKAMLRIPLALGGIRGWMKPTQVFNHVAYGVDDEETKEEVSDRLRVAFLTNIVSPYRAPVFKRLASTPKWDFKLFVDAEKEFDRKWDVSNEGFDCVKTKTWSIRRIVRSTIPIRFNQEITLHIPYGLIRDLYRFKPEVLISHELGFRTIIAAIYSMMTGVPLVIWAYQSRISASQGQGRNWLRKWLLGRARYVVGMGTQAREVLRSWDVPNRKILDAPNAANHEAFETCLRKSTIAEEIRSISLDNAPERKLAIVVGRLVPLKGVDQLLESWKQLSDQVRSEWKLVFIGDGPLKPMIEEADDPSIDVFGHVDTDSMAAWYMAADLHIFPTCGDVWGLVVNESSLCGTPTLCSIHAGCSDDMIRDGENGLAIDFTDEENRVAHLENALRREDLSELGREAQTDAATYRLSGLAESFRSAALLAMEDSFNGVGESRSRTVK